MRTFVVMLLLIVVDFVRDFPCPSSASLRLTWADFWSAAKSVTD